MAQMPQTALERSGALRDLGIILYYVNVFVR
jgi:hypothetical protein